FRAPALHRPGAAGIARVGNRFAGPLAAVNANRLLLLLLHILANRPGRSSLFLIGNHHAILLLDVVSHRVVHAAGRLALFLIGNHHAILLLDVIGHRIIHAAACFAALLVLNHHALFL